MGKFLVRLALFAAIQTAIGAVWWACQPPLLNDYLAATRDKDELLAAGPKPQLVLVGGSNVAFGFDGSRLAARWAGQPVNLGLHASLGLAFMLDEVRPALRPGDVVVVAPEYEQFDREGNPQVILAVLIQRPAAALCVPWATWKAMLDQGIPLISDYVRRGRDEFWRHLHRVEFCVGFVPPYCRTAFGPYGDIRLRGPRPKQFPLGGGPMGLNNLPEAADLLNRFGEWCRARGVYAFYSHPAVSQTWFRTRPGEFVRVDAEIQRALTIPRLDRLDELVFPDADFLDTPYHLTAEGTRKRSDLLADHLAHALGRPLKSDGPPGNLRRPAE